MSIYNNNGQFLALKPYGAVTWGPGVILGPGFPATSTGRLWANLNGPDSLNRDHLMMNVMKQADRWTAQYQGVWGAGVQFITPVQDVNGYPTVMPAEIATIETFLLRGQAPESAALLNGRYRFLYDGAGSLEITGAGVSNVAAAPGQIEFDYAVSAGSAVVLRITAITQGNHPRNMRCFHTRYADRVAAGYVTRPDFAFKGVKTLRFLDTFGGTLGIPGPQQYCWSGTGAPIGDVIKICNELGINPWINLPYNQPESYYLTIAQALRADLNPALKVHVEWSNEYWNPIFPVYAYCTQQAQALWGVDPGNGPAYWMQYAGGRAAQAMDIFAGVFAGQMNRLVRVAGVHTGWVGLSTPMLDAPLWVALGNAQPALSFDALAVTGYFGSGLHDTGVSAQLWNVVQTSGQQAGFTWLANWLRQPGNESSLPELFQAWADFRVICNQRGYALLMYEGGTHVLLAGADQNNQAFVNFISAFNYSQEVTDLYRELLIQWDTVGNGGFNAFVTTSGPSQYGSWGAQRWAGDNNPRAQLLLAYNNAPLTALGSPAYVGETMTAGGNVITATIPPGTLSSHSLVAMAWSTNTSDPATMAGPDGWLPGPSVILPGTGRSARVFTAPGSVSDLTFNANGLDHVLVMATTAPVRNLAFNGLDYTQFGGDTAFSDTPAINTTAGDLIVSAYVQSSIGTQGLTPMPNPGNPEPGFERERVDTSALPFVSVLSRAGAQTGHQGPIGHDGAGTHTSRYLLTFTAGNGVAGTPVGGQSLDAYYMLNSLHNHDAGAGNANTSTGNWLRRLGLQAPNGGNTWTQGSLFGFANGWEIPPRGGGQEEVTNPYIVDEDPGNGSWVGAQNIEVVGFVPDNFSGPLVDPNAQNGLGFTYQTRLLELIDAWQANASNPNRRYRVYAGWKLLDGYGASTVAGLTPTMISQWITDSLGAYDTWQQLLVSRLQAARPTLNIGIHNVNRALMLTYRDTAVSTIPATDLFEDLAPHGRSTWYFLAAIAEYIELYNEKPPANFVFNPAWGVHATVQNNYQAIVDFMWNALRS